MINDIIISTASNYSLKLMLVLPTPTGASSLACEAWREEDRAGFDANRFLAPHRGKRYAEARHPAT